MNRRERYARVICTASGQDPSKLWPPQVPHGSPIKQAPMWTFHIPAADAVLKQADEDLAKHGKIP